MENTTIFATEKNTVAVAFISDDGYVMPTCVAINSLICSKKPETVYHIHIVCASLSEESQEIFRRFESETVHIHILRQDADRFANLHVFEEDSYCVATPAALLKFVLPELLTDYDRVLYLDGDLLVREDLTQLFHTELGDAYLAAVTDSGTMYLRNKIRESVQHYFNSGVMLLNLAQMRKDNLTEVLIRAKAELNDSSLMDQNVFNCVCDGRTVRLPVRYNFLPINLLRNADQWTLEQLNQLYGTRYPDEYTLFTDAAIIHFASKDKPWKDDTVAFADDWYHCYYQAPIDHPLKRSHTAAIRHDIPKISILFAEMNPQILENIQSQTLQDVEILQGTYDIRQAHGQYVIFADGLLLTDSRVLAHFYEIATSNDLDVLLFDCNSLRRKKFYPTVFSGQTLYTQFFRNRDFTLIPNAAVYRRDYLLKQISEPDSCPGRECFSLQALICAERVKYLCNIPCRRLDLPAEPDFFQKYVTYHTAACFLLELLRKNTLMEDTRHAGAMHVNQLLACAHNALVQLSAEQQLLAKQQVMPLDYALLAPALNLYSSDLFPSDHQKLVQYRAEIKQLIEEKVERWEILQSLYKEKGERWQELQALKKEKGQRYQELQALKKENAALQKAGIHRNGTIVIKLPSKLVRLIAKIAAKFKKGA